MTEEEELYQQTLASLRPRRRRVKPPSFNEGEELIPAGDSAPPPAKAAAKPAAKPEPKADK
ncbi:hypothetical protein IQ265_23215 [Nodosilinea sp. LEGE 06152]|uniref:hypothetical protein n=1 Tax=Nodosilinea sp. LEGE 06152 TaxID=2777966 RepID=UPI00187F3ED9|nr:hypothetical protein [Nodosilinea sp. LEGE 06152]MBE9159722.1 hypothetical protein [Nodosilinea sp. LEGE 06152]